MTDILEEDGDEYVDTFPISINPYEYQFDSDEALAEWKKKYNILVSLISKNLISHNTVKLCAFSMMWALMPETITC